MTKRYSTRILRHTLGVFLLGLVLTAGASAQDATFDSVQTGDLYVDGSASIYAEDGVYIDAGDVNIDAEDVDVYAERDVRIDAEDIEIGGDEIVIDGDEVIIAGQDIYLFGDTFFEAGIVSLGNLPASGNELLYIGGKKFPSSPFVFREPRIVVENQTSPATIREMFSLINNGGSLFTFTDTNLDSTWLFSSNSVGDFNVSLSGTGGSELAVTKTGRVIMGPGGVKNFDLRPNGNLHILGTLFQSSDRNLKEEFADVEPASVLGKIDQLPVTTWQFKANESGNRHMGPTAQDFYAAFGLGKDEKTIAPVDGVGVSLAGIKALSTQGKQKDAEIKKLSQQLQSQKELIENQQQLLKRLASRLSALESKTQASTVGLVGSAVVAK